MSQTHHLEGVLYFFNGLVFEQLHQKQLGGIFP